MGVKSLQAIPLFLFEDKYTYTGSAQCIAIFGIFGYYKYRS